MAIVGTLYVVSTPIGNLEDITLRALRILKEADLILCEDTRVTSKLLSHFQIKKPLESFFEHSEVEKTTKVIERLSRDQNVVLVTDGGTPTISDPGFRLVKAAIGRGVPVVPIPGPSAVIAALSVSGLPTDKFTFVGFLPQKEGKRKNFLEKIKDYGGTVVAYESPNRLIFTLNNLLEILGDVPVCIAREMTKIHEEIYRGSVVGAIEHFKDKEVKGEVTLVISLV